MQGAHYSGLLGAIGLKLIETLVDFEEPWPVPLRNWGHHWTFLFI